MDLFFNTEKEKRVYCVYYSVKGELPTDRIETNEEGAIIVFRNWNIKNEGYSNTGMERPYFIIEISDVFLPWCLKEPRVNRRDRYLDLLLPTPLIAKIKVSVPLI